LVAGELKSQFPFQAANSGSFHATYNELVRPPSNDDLLLVR
jgi:hypothetical protein